MPVVTGAEGQQAAWMRFGPPGGAPALVLHAGMTRGALWAPIARALGPDVDLVAMDLLDHGDSDPGVTDRPQAECAALARQVLEAAFDGGPAHLIGHSFGATVALRLAVEAPAACLSLTLFEPVCFAFAAEAGDPAYQAYLQQVAPMAAAHDAGDLRLATDRFIATWGGPPLTGMPPERQARRIRQFGQVWASGPELILTDTPGRMRLDQLGALGMPVTLVRGALTQPVIAAIHRAILTRVARGAEHVIDGAGHMAPLTHPQAAAPLIAATLRAG